MKKYFAFYLVLIANILFAQHIYANETLKAIQQYFHAPTIMHQFYDKNQVTTTIKDTITRAEVPETHTLEQIINDGAVPTQLFRRPKFTPEAAFALSGELLKEKLKALRSNNRRRPRRSERLRMRRAILKELIESTKRNVDPDVIEGVSIASVDASPEEVLQIFSALDKFHNYAPNIFLESVMIGADVLHKRNITPCNEIKYQFSKTAIGMVYFSQIIRYEISKGHDTIPVRQEDNSLKVIRYPKIDVAWQMDKQYFKYDDDDYAHEGVVTNSGHLKISPYINPDGTLHAHRSIITYHIYIKLAEDNQPLGGLGMLFKEGKARSVIKELAEVLREEAKHIQHVDRSSR